MRGIGLALLLALVFAPAEAPADTINVDVNGGGEQTSILAGALLASEGDTVLVAPGTYSGANNTDLDTHGMNLIFASRDGADVTFIDGGATHAAFYITDGQDSTTIIRGFTISDCHPSTGSGAMEISNSSPIVEDCVFVTCEANWNGGGIAFSNSFSTVRDCVFRGNAGGFRGGAVYSYNGGVTLSRCLFDGNTASTTYAGGAIYSNSSSDVYLSCTFVNNVSDAVRTYHANDLVMANCIVAYTEDGYGVYDEGLGSLEIYHCLVFKNAEGDSLPGHHHNNLFLDPLFCDAEADDYTHCSDSECLPPYNDWTGLIGAYGEGCGPCNTPVRSSSWGVVKALFRSDRGLNRVSG